MAGAAVVAVVVVGAATVVAVVVGAVVVEVVEVVAAGAAVVVVALGPATVVVVVAGVASPTVNVVAQASLAEHAPPCTAAAVVSFVPAGALAATRTWKVAVAIERDDPGSFNAGTDQLSVLALRSIAMDCLTRSASVVVTMACPSRPDRSSTTIVPDGCVTVLLAFSV
jgi:hypothetical protein